MISLNCPSCLKKVELDVPASEGILSCPHCGAPLRRFRSAAKSIKPDRRERVAPIIVESEPTLLPHSTPRPRYRLLKFEADLLRALGVLWFIGCLIGVCLSILASRVAYSPTDAGAWVWVAYYYLFGAPIGGVLLLVMGEAALAFRDMVLNSWRIAEASEQSKDHRMSA